MHEFQKVGNNLLLILNLRSANFPSPTREMVFFDFLFIDQDSGRRNRPKKSIGKVLYAKYVEQEFVYIFCLLPKFSCRKVFLPYWLNWSLARGGAPTSSFLGLKKSPTYFVLDANAISNRRFKPLEE